MPSNDFKYHSLSIVVFGVALLVFNVFNWTQPPSVLATIKPHLGRGLASIEDNSGMPKLRNLKILTYDCNNPQEFNTAEKEVRIALHNCKAVEKLSKITNSQNYFQATLFTENKFFITDYIPLVDKINSIHVAGPRQSALKIVVNRTYHDAR